MSGVGPDWNKMLQAMRSFVHADRQSYRNHDRLYITHYNLWPDGLAVWESDNTMYDNHKVLEHIFW